MIDTTTVKEVKEALAGLSDNAVLIIRTEEDKDGGLWTTLEHKGRVILAFYAEWDRS